MKEKESDIQKAVLDYLRIKENQGKCYCYRTQAGAVRVEKAGYKGFMKFGRAGVPDITCVINGKFVGIEIKTSTGKMSEAQTEAKKAVEVAGGRYFVVRNLEDVQKII